MVIVRSARGSAVRAFPRLALIAVAILALLSGSARLEASAPAIELGPRLAIKSVIGKAERALISCHKVVRLEAPTQFSLQIAVSQRTGTVVRILSSANRR